MTFLLEGTEEVRSDKAIAFQKALGYNIDKQKFIGVNVKVLERLTFL